MAYAAAKTEEMARAGFVAMLGPLIDTIIICTMTAVVIITTGVWQVKSDKDELLYGPGGKGVPVTMMIEGNPVQVVGSAEQDGEPFLDENGQPQERKPRHARAPAGLGTSPARVGEDPQADEESEQHVHPEADRLPGELPGRQQQ